MNIFSYLFYGSYKLFSSKASAAILRIPTACMTVAPAGTTNAYVDVARGSGSVGSTLYLDDVVITNNN